MLNIQALDRLKAQLQTTGLQQKNFQLYQIISQLIDFQRQSIDLTTKGLASVNTTIINSNPPVTQIIQGDLIGIDGIDGIDGETGIKGNDGVRGNDGLSIPGIDGEDGLDGIDGISGKDGINGIDGIIGRDGLSISGLDGIDGEDGISDIPGPSGLTGQQGPIGSQGIPGFDGINGDTIEKETILVGNNVGIIFTPGSVIFAGPGGLFSQDNANFFWDNTNKRLVIGGVIKSTIASGLALGSIAGVRRIQSDGTTFTFLTDIDSYAPLLCAGITINGLLTVSNLGAHSFIAGGAGGNDIRIQNTTAGTANWSAFYIGNDSSYATGFLMATSSAYTPSGERLADTFIIDGFGVGGISIASRDASGVIRFYTGGTTERVRIDTVGNVGIGLTPAFSLDVRKDQNSVSAFRLSNQNSGSSASAMFGFGTYGNSWGCRVGSAAMNGNNFDIVVDAFGSPVPKLTIATSGLIKMAAYGAGAATFDASGNITSVSDERFKDRINLLPYGLSHILKLNPIQHGYNKLSKLEQEHLYGGFIAQEVQVIMPLAVGMNSDGYLTLADRPILGAVVNAIKELNLRLMTLEN